MIKYVYVASAITPYETEEPVEGYWGNVRRALRASTELLLLGYFPFCPPVDDWFHMMVHNGERVTRNMLLKYSKSWLEKCDAVLVLSRWRKSEGVKAEIARAKELSIPVFYNMDDLLDYDGEKEE